MALRPRDEAAGGRQINALENSRGPAKPGVASIWDDPEAAARLLVSRSTLSMIEPLMSAARAQQNAQRAAAWALLEDWDESKHPRDEDGRFRDAGGGSAGQAGEDKLSGFETAGEHAGADGSVSDSFKAKVQAALEALDPQVAAWWASNSVWGSVKARNASGWLTFYRSNETSSVTPSGQPQITVDNKYTAGQTAQAIITAAREDAWPTGIGVPFFMHRSGRGDAPAEFTEWRKKSYSDAAQDAAVLAEIHTGTIAGLTPAGDLVVAVNDVVENGITWNTVLQALPLIGKALPHVSGAIILKISKTPGGPAKEITITQKTWQLLKSLPLAKQRAITKASAELRDAKKAAEYIAKEADAAAVARAASAATKYSAHLGKATSNDYAKTFIKANPKLAGKVVIHHAVPQHVLKKYPGIIDESELHSLENLRGIPKDANSALHLKEIRDEWRQFYDTHPNATKKQLLEKATEIDLKYGGRFTPKIGS